MFLFQVSMCRFTISTATSNTEIQAMVLYQLRKKFSNNLGFLEKSKGFCIILLSHGLIKYIHVYNL